MTTPWPTRHLSGVAWTRGEAVGRSRYNRLVILEPWARTMVHHFVNFLVDLAPAAEQAGYRIRAVVNREIEAPARRALEAAGCEVAALFYPQRYNRPPPRIYWPASSLHFARVLRAEMASLDPADIICNLAAHIQTAVGAIPVVVRRSHHNPLLVQFYWDVAPLDVPPWRMGHLFPKLLAASLKRRRVRERLRICAHGGVLSGHIAETLGCPVGSLPHPVNWDKFAIGQAGNETPIVGFLGDMRQDKGFTQFADAIPLVIRRLTVLAQAYGVPDLLEDGAPDAADRLEAWGAELVRRPTSPTEYGEMLGRLDIVVLPYPPRSYRRRTSGILIEAVGAQKIVVAPRDTWLGEVLVEHDLGVTYDDYSPIGLARAIDTAIDDRHRLAQRLRANGARWRKTNSAEGFLGALIQLSAPGGAQD